MSLKRCWHTPGQICSGPCAAWTPDGCAFVESLRFQAEALDRIRMALQEIREDLARR